MKKNTIIKRIILIYIALSAVLFSLTMSINIVTKDKNYYYKYSEKNNIAEYAGVDSDKLKKMYSNLIDYIYKGDQNLINTDFNKREVSHMVDVNKLYNINIMVTYVATISLIAYIVYLSFAYKKKRSICRELKFIRKIFLTILFAMIILSIIISIDFDSAFIKFHHLFFNNDLWLLDPRTDIMIRMLPQDFFMNMAIRIGLYFVRFLALIYIILTILIRNNKEK
ncbi:TIGR01906 family membrane protein [Helcococcus sueciensis]|uniref:TIGR01906 family membrane protein n=1 Tax=Helcococcus sueciensis TaxID=241555 RepID=UPI0003F8CFBB|nr:TIGR01906 family membrane protein [Helcococcus sueciensis]